MVIWRDIICLFHSDYLMRAQWGSSGFVAGDDTIFLTAKGTCTYVDLCFENPSVLLSETVNLERCSSHKHTLSSSMTFKDVRGAWEQKVWEPLSWTVCFCSLPCFLKVAKWLPHLNITAMSQGLFTGKENFPRSPSDFHHASLVRIISHIHSLTSHCNGLTHGLQLNPVFLRAMPCWCMNKIRVYWAREKGGLYNVR